MERRGKSETEKKNLERCNGKNETEIMNTNKKEEKR